MCPKCDKLQEAIIKTKIKLLPRVLIIHLKRFANNSTKLKNPLEFEETIKIDKEYMTMSDKQKNSYSSDYINISEKERNQEENHRYNLYALIIHEGFSTQQGHYFCFIKNNKTGLWFKYDDDQVKCIGYDLKSV